MHSKVKMAKHSVEYQTLSADVNSIRYQNFFSKSKAGPKVLVLEQNLRTKLN